MNVTGKLYCLLSVLALSITASAQTTNTNCTTQTYGSNGQINCTSTTQQPQQQSQAGQQIGTALGGAIGRSWAQHQQVKNYCKFHPGEAWHDENYSRAGVCKATKQKNQPYPAAWCAEHPESMYGNDQLCSAGKP
jgi:hypothetical protein